MYSSTAYEALYQYLGLAIHSKSIEFITSQAVFQGALLLTFGIVFIMTTIRFFSRYMPGNLVARKSVPLSRYFKIVLCLFLGVAVLKVGSTEEVKSFSNKNWSDNPYILHNNPDIQREYKVSFLFKLLSGATEEIGWAIGSMVDRLFQSSHSQLEAPNFFFKSIMYAGSSTIEDPKLRELIEFYTEECFQKTIVQLGNKKALDQLDGFFSDSSEIDRKLDQIPLAPNENPDYTCLSLKDEVNEKILEYARAKSPGMQELWPKYNQRVPHTPDFWTHVEASNFLRNYYIQKREDGQGIHKGAYLPGTSPTVFQSIKRFFSVDGFLATIGQRDVQGAGAAASRSLEFSEALHRAPHLAGLIKLALIAVFPWLVFLVVGGYWKALAYWVLTYLSVVLWAPMWTLLYHLVTNIALSVEVMEQFGKLSGGVSMYASQVIDYRINFLFVVYSYVQVLIGPMFTGAVLWFVRPLLANNQEERLDDFVGGAPQAIQAGAQVGSKFL